MMKTLNFKGIEYEECSREEAVTSDDMTKKGYLKIGFPICDTHTEYYYFKQVPKFPILFEGYNFKFKIFSDLTFSCSSIFINNEHTCEFTPKDIEANKKALEELERLKKQ